MAAEFGPFDGFADNADDMLRVIRNHKRAANGVARDSGEYEKLRLAPVPINHSLFLDDTINITNAGALLGRAVQAWDEALDLGGRHGFRNAQVTVIAPTGTIGLLMDCDTTGVEPDFALTKFKKLAGGGYFKIANQSLRPALLALGYSAHEVEQIMLYVMGTLILDTPMPKTVADDGEIISFTKFLLNNGSSEEEIDTMNDSLPTVFELSFAFAAWLMPEHVLEALGTSREEATANPSFNGLQLLGLTNDEISELNRRICGTGTIEGAPNLAEEHLPVFDCANRCGETGIRYIAAEGHIRMMAACQPFITGAISKTINLPNEATTQDIAKSYWLSWELGLKANALYRDGCKLSQPLNAKVDVILDDDEDEVEVAAAYEEIANEVIAAADMAKEDQPKVIEKIVERIIEKPMRRRLPDTRRSITHHFNVAGHEGYLTVGMYETGGPGELFITMSKEGSTIGGLMDSLGTAISVALQYGVPIESLVSKFAYQRFEPQGITTNRDIPFAKSLVDYIFQWMGMQFIEGYKEANLPNRAATSTLPNHPEPMKRTTPVKEDKRWSGLPQEDTNITRRDSVSTDLGGITPKVSIGKAKTDAVVVQERYDRLSIQTSESSVQVEEITAQSSLSQSNAKMQGDAPACPSCGAITVRNGTCYKCMNCGDSLGCS
jgi:ribonucleoside-diphosphate reductase alpha chain